MKQTRPNVDILSFCLMYSIVTENVLKIELPCNASKKKIFLLSLYFVFPNEILLHYAISKWLWYWFKSCQHHVIYLYMLPKMTIASKWGEVPSDWSFIFLCNCVLSFQEIFLKKKIDIKSCENSSVRKWEFSFRNNCTYPLCSKWWKKWINGFWAPREKIICNKGEGDRDKLEN